MARARTSRILLSSLVLAQLVLVCLSAELIIIDSSKQWKATYAELMSSDPPKEDRPIWSLIEALYRYNQHGDGIRGSRNAEIARLIGIGSNQKECSSTTSFLLVQLQQKYYRTSGLREWLDQIQTGLAAFCPKHMLVSLNKRMNDKLELMASSMKPLINGSMSGEKFVQEAEERHRARHHCQDIEEVVHKFGDIDYLDTIEQVCSIDPSCSALAKVWAPILEACKATRGLEIVW